MIDLSDLLSNDDLARAKQRVWTRMHSKLPARELGAYQGLAHGLGHVARSVQMARLEKVQIKERILDMLPDRQTAPFLFSRRFVAVSTLSMFVGVLGLPVFQATPVMAQEQNRLHVVQGDVFVNSELVDGSKLLHEGDQIHTTPGSIAHIAFMDDSRVTLGPSTAVELDALDRDPVDASRTDIVLDQKAGRVWTQAVNLVPEKSSLTVSFPAGEIRADQKATFDVQVDGGDAEVQVVEHMVAVTVDKGETRRGFLGEGALMRVEDEVVTDTLPEASEVDVWWEFNEAYGEDYLEALEDSYREELSTRVSVMPDHPFYGIKTFREDLHAAMSFSDEAKRQLALERVRARFDEARILLDQGRVEEAQEKLEEYKQGLEEFFDGSQDAELLADLNEVQKELLAQNVSEMTELLETSLVEATLVLESDEREESKVLTLSASQKLARVPELMKAGNYDQARRYLQAYQDFSLSGLAGLEDLSAEERELAVAELLQHKLEDMHILEGLASMPEFGEVVDVDASLFEQMSVMVLTLEEHSVENLVDYFESADHDAAEQREVYERLMDSSDLTPELSEQFEVLEEAVEDDSEDGVVIELELAEESDESVAHADESEDEAQDGE